MIIVGATLSIRAGSAHRESSQTQLTSQFFPPSGEKDCSIRADLGERLYQQYLTSIARPL